jgi:hypothetical protein
MLINHRINMGKVGFAFLNVILGSRCLAKEKRPRGRSMARMALWWSERIWS